MHGRRVALTLCLSSIACVGPGPSSIESQPGVEPHGQLVIVDGREHPYHGVVRLELGRTTVQPLFSAPRFSRVHQLAVSSDGGRVVFAYSPPPGRDSGFMDRSGLFSLELGRDGAEPEPLVEADQAQRFHLEPALTPDGRFVFYVKVVSVASSVIPTFTTTLERLDLASGETELIAPDGIWPRVSTDGTRLTFIGVHPPTQQRGLYVSRLDGSELQMLVPIGRFFDIDTPVFSPDDESIYFTVAERAPTVSWLDQLLGITPVLAHTDHNVPSDWWRIPTAGGAAERLTDRTTVIVHGAFDSTGSRLAFSSKAGLFLVDRAGTDWRRLRDATFYGTLGWLPEGG